MRTALVGALAIGLGLQASQPVPIPGPRGTHTENGLAGFAKILCSGVFVSGRAPEDVVTGSAYFFMPQAERDQVQWDVDRTARLASASLGATKREARFYGDQGCIIQDPEKPGIHFTPVPVRTRLPDAASQPWPMGDRTDNAPAAANVDAVKMAAAADAAFADPAAMTAAFLVVHKGRIVAERYAAGITRDTQLESWSMGKSLAATLFALLVKDGTYTLEQPAQVPLWRSPGDPRGSIRNIDLLRMSAGLKFLGNQEPGSNQTCPDHYYIYTGGIDAFDYSITRPQEYAPNTDGRYRNSDPLTITYLAKLAVTSRGENFLTWPQRALFDRIGIRRQVLDSQAASATDTPAKVEKAPGPPPVITAALAGKGAQVLSVIYPTDRQAYGQAMAMMLTFLPMGSMDNPAADEKLQKELDTFFAKHKLKPPFAREPADPFQGVDLPAFVSDSMLFLKSHAKKGEDPGLPVPSGKPVDVTITGDTAVAILGGKEVKFARISGKWFIRLE